MSKKVKRLFRGFKPQHYDINLAIAEDKKTFSGSVTIKGEKTSRPSKRLCLHQKALKITNPKIVYSNKKGQTSEPEIERVLLHKSYDELRLHTKQTLYPGKYEISLDFSGKITKNMDGLYPCFFEEDGVKKELVATQFESHHAREAFPCIDEPEAKATFQLTLTHAKSEAALSNTPVASTADEHARMITVFEQTPIMSTYLLAFVVGELKFKETSSKSGVKIRAYAVGDQVEHTDFALTTAAKAMDFYEQYYDIPFPLAKCDFVALPDFAAGAMENWGLITFREQLLLCDDHTSLSTKQYIAIVVAHELTHQWFGNLVTMRWWTDLWLNEGFASWMEYLAVDSLFPNWQLWTQFAVDEQQSALKADALEHTHPIEVPIKHPDEIRTIFDIISYQKGASVIHMLHDYLGARSFRDGLRHYLKTHAYQNTDTVDLWQALEDVTKKPVKKFMSAWTSQSGFPILQIEAAADHLKIGQRRFVTNPDSPARQDSTLWPVPLLCDDLTQATIHKRLTNVPLKDKPPLLINAGQTGFYRVDYSHQLQQAQLKAIDSNKLNDVDRMGLLSDGFEVTRAGYQPVTEFLDLLSHFSEESSLPTWDIIAGSIGSIRQILSATDTDNTLRDQMKPFIRGLVAKQLSRLGWEPSKSEPHLETLLRPLIIGLAAAADDEPTIAKALEQYRIRMSSDKLIDPDLRGIVYSTAARLGGEKEYTELLSLYKKTKSADEKLSITAAMTSFEQPQLHTAVLELIRSDTIRLQDIGYWVAYSFMNRHSRAATWDWLKLNWDWLKLNLGTDLSFSRTPVYAARTFSDARLLDDFRNFFSGRMEPMIARSYNQGLEIAETNVAWRQRDSTAALRWFKSNS